MSLSPLARSPALGLLLIAAAATSPACASAQEVERSRGFLDVIFGASERVSGERSAQLQEVERTAQTGSPDLLVRLERLEAQLRQLTGVIEQLQYRNAQLESQVRRMQEDGEYRSQESGGKVSRPLAQARPYGAPTQSAPASSVAASPSSVAPSASPPPAPSAGRRGDAFDPEAHPNAPGAPHLLGSLGQPRGGSLDVAAMPSQGAQPGAAPAGALPPTLPPSQTPKDEFDLAYGYVLRRDYALAEQSFRGFLSKYPNDRLSGDATFWYGESLFQQQRFRDAAEAFLNASTKFEGNPKAPDALLRLGQSLAALGEKEAACASLGEAVRKFPHAPASLKQGVAREQKRVRC
jgi:tol-pal system protein YbgF